MDGTGADQSNFDYFLGVSSTNPGALPSGTALPDYGTSPPVQPHSLEPAVSSTNTDGNAPINRNGNTSTLSVADVVTGPGGGGGGGGGGGATSDGTAGDKGGDASANDTAGTDSAGAGGTNPKKRPLEDKKARDRKRILRNRQLARVSNERRKGRIKAMENELTETRNTVSTLEESIRCLEEENRELRNLLQGRSDGTLGVTTSITGAAPIATNPADPPSTSLPSGIAQPQSGSRP